MKNKRTTKKREGTGRERRKGKSSLSIADPRESWSRRAARKLLIGLLVTGSREDEHSVGLGMKSQVHRRGSLRTSDRAEESGREENEGNDGGVGE